MDGWEIRTASVHLCNDKKVNAKHGTLPIEVAVSQGWKISNAVVEIVHDVGIHAHLRSRNL